MIDDIDAMLEELIEKDFRGIPKTIENSKGRQEVNPDYKEKLLEQFENNA